MPVQIRNGESSRLNTPDMQYRFDPAIGFAEADNIYLSLPGLVGFWPGNAQGSSSSSLTEMADKGPRQLHLTQNGAPVLTANSDKLAVWQQFNGSADWYNHADASTFDITGAVTLMAWVNFDTAPSVDEVITGKWAASNFSYRLSRGSAGLGSFQVSNTGAAAVTVTTTSTITADKWWFLCGRFSPGVELKLWTGSISNLSTDTNTTSIPASLFNGTADFGIGAQSGGANFMDGGISRVGLYNVALPDVFVDVTFQRTRQIYGAI